MNKKKFIYKVYDINPVLWDVATFDVDNWDNSNLFVDNWSQEVVNEPQFRTTINSGASELVVRLGRKFNSFGEGYDVKLGNTVRLYVYDVDNPNGARIFTGKISAYTPILNGTDEYVDVTLLGLAYEFENYILRDIDGNTTLEYNSHDPGEILKDILDKYTYDGGSVTYTNDSIDLTGTSVSYTFSLNTIKEAIDKINELAPYGWYWYVDSEGVMQFHKSEDQTVHKVVIGRDVSRLQTSRTTEQIVNRIYGVGGIPESSIQLYKIYSRPNSIDAYGLKARKMIDGRVTLEDTMGLIAEKDLDTYESPITRSVLTLVDNNGNNSLGIDIESLNVGDFVNITNLRYGSVEETLWDQVIWDVDVWNQPLELNATENLVIVSISYTLDNVVLEVADRLPEVQKRIEDIKRNLEQEQTKNIPISPSE